MENVIVKEGITVDFSQILNIGEKYTVQLKNSSGKRFKYLDGKSVLVSRFVVATTQIKDPVSTNMLTIPTALIVQTPGYKICKPGVKGKSSKDSFVVICQNDHLPIGTIIHSPVKGRESIKAFNLKGNSVFVKYMHVAPLDKVEVVKPNTNKDKIVMPESQIKEQLKGIQFEADSSYKCKGADVGGDTIKEDWEVEQKVISAPPANMDTDIPKLLDKVIDQKAMSNKKLTVALNLSVDLGSIGKMLSRDFADTVADKLVKSEDAFTDLNGEVHTSLYSAMQENERILTERAKDLVLNAVKDLM